MESDSLLRRGVGLVVLLSLLAATGCDRHRKVSKAMTWRCAPERYNPGYPAAQPVLFHFVENPHHEMLIYGGGLCDQLESSGKPVVSVEFDVWGSRRGGVRGIHEVKIDGQPLIDIGPGGWYGAHSNGPDDPIGPHPFVHAFD